MAKGLMGMFESIFGKKNKDVARLQPQVDALDLFADDETEGNRTQSKGQQEEDYQQHGTVTSGCELNRDRPGCQ